MGRHCVVRWFLSAWGWVLLPLLMQLPVAWEAGDGGDVQVLGPVSQMRGLDEMEYLLQGSSLTQHQLWQVSGQ